MVVPQYLPFKVEGGKMYFELMKTTYAIGRILVGNRPMSRTNIVETIAAAGQASLKQAYGGALLKIKRNSDLKIIQLRLPSKVKP